MLSVSVHPLSCEYSWVRRGMYWGLCSREWGVCLKCGRFTKEGDLFFHYSVRIVHNPITLGSKVNGKGSLSRSSLKWQWVLAEKMVLVNSSWYAWKKSFTYKNFGWFPLLGEHSFLPIRRTIGHGRCHVLHINSCILCTFLVVNGSRNALATVIVIQ